MNAYASFADFASKAPYGVFCLSGNKNWPEFSNAGISVNTWVFIIGVMQNDKTYRALVMWNTPALRYVCGGASSTSFTAVKSVTLA